MALKRGMDLTCAKIVEKLRTLSREVSGRKDIAQVGMISANQDKEIGDLIARALDQVGNEGIVQVDEARSIETNLNLVEGMQFDRGYLSPYFVTDAERMEVVLENASVLIHDKKISVLTDLVPILEIVAQKGQPLLVIAEEVDGEALAALVVNKLRGTLHVCAVKAPGFGDRRKEMLEDIAALTSARVVSEDMGLKLENATSGDLGSCRRVVIDKDSTTLIGGGGKKAEVEDRCRQIRAAIENTTSDYDREKFQERLARLTGGVAVLSVGAATEMELKERKSRVEDALAATRAAIEEGVVVGGGVALVRAAQSLNRFKLKGDENLGRDIVIDALTAPARQIAENAGEEGPIVLAEIESKDGAWGFDAQARAVVDLEARGVLDPTKVTRTALQNAVSIAGMILTTEALITDRAEEDEDEEGDD
jgi:chaperonin GroEL